MVKCPGCGEENPPKFRLCGYCGTALPKAAALPVHEVRKTVTLLFCDLKGSTALGEHLDPEALHEVKERYFAAMAAEITRHGGKIEKYIGDAIMAVFGLPRAREDDALRAVRAAAGMQRALVDLNAGLRQRYGITLANRTGVNTGEVVANDDPTADQKLATGDAVNVCARLEQAAPENQIYLGEVTWRLVRDAVEVEAVEPLELKGKAQRVPAYRLVRAEGQDGLVRRHDRPLVGRDEELATLRSVFGRVAEGRAAGMVTVIGDAGAGKSRLVHEVVDRIAVGARVLSGRCLPYGEGITYWPLMMMVREAAGILDDDGPAVAREKLEACVGERQIAERLAGMAGYGDAAFPMHEINWAARKFLEGQAAHGPLIAFVDDIHWAEGAFLDLLEHVVDATTSAPVLVLATSRHDLLEQRPDWGSSPRSARIVLRPLSDADSAQVVANLLGGSGLAPGVVDRIVRAAEGNPLYVEQMLSMLIDGGALRLEDGQWVRAGDADDIVVPPTIQALLEARLDQLARIERLTVEPASVIGLEFAQPAVESLAPEAVRPELQQHLGALTRKRFIRPADGTGGMPSFRFHHHLVRDTVYNGLLKRTRAALHLEFVRWADRLYAERAPEYDEILGYHLEQASQYSRELGPLDEQGRAVARDAAARLGRSAARAFARGDMHAATNLYGRAAALLAADDATRVAMLPELGEALMELGDFDRARAVLAEAETLAERVGEPRHAAKARLIGMFVRLYGGEPGDWSAEALARAEAEIPTLQRLGAHGELATAWRLVAFVHGVAGRFGQANDATVHYMAAARAAGNARLVARSGMGFAMGALSGPTPVPEAIAECERIVAGGLADRQVRSVVTCVLAQLRAMNGEFDEARRLVRHGRAMLQELGQGVSAASTGIDLASVELLAGDLAGAEREIRADREFLQRAGETYFLATLEGMLARLVRDQGRDDEALELTRSAEASAAEDDVDAQVLWRIVRAPILARQGLADAAIALAREALALARGAEAPAMRADALKELAATLRVAGREDEAAAAIDEAIALCEAKGDRISAARARAWRAAAAAVG